MSNVLSGTGRVAPETARRVREVADRLGYRVDAGARALRAGGSPVVGLVMDLDLIGMDSLIPGLWWPRVLFSCADRLASLGCVIAVLPTIDLAPGPTMRLDAIVAVERSDGSPGLPSTIPYGTPVFFGGPGAPRDSAQVVPDFAGLVADGLGHLAARGARRTGLICPPSPISAPGLMRDAFETWHASRGLPVGPVSGAGDARDQVSELLAAGCDAVFSTTNTSPELLRALLAHGCDVPGDVRLLTLSEGVIEHWLDPSVTVMSLQGAVNGIRLAEAIDEALRSGSPRDVLLEHRLIEGGSTGP